jgi:hypothetical protein
MDLVMLMANDQVAERAVRRSGLDAPERLP